MLSFLYSPTLTYIHDHWKNIALTRRTFVGKVMSLVFNMLSRFVITFLPRSKHLLISWLKSPSAVILPSSHLILCHPAALLEPPERPQGSPASSSVWREDPGLLSRPCRKRRPSAREDGSHPYMTTGENIALTRRTFVGKVMSLLLNMLSRFVITFL